MCVVQLAGGGVTFIGTHLVRNSKNKNVSFFSIGHLYFEDQINKGGVYGFKGRLKIHPNFTINPIKL